jgi:uncharacterized protein YdhG (YjbR/CyaY superfamily)
MQTPGIPAGRVAAARRSPAVTTFATVDEYIASFPPEVQEALQAVRGALRKAAPGTDETISYGIPTLTLDGQYVVYFAGWKRHISLYPIPADDPVLASEMAPYIAGKGTLRFPLNMPIPLDLVERVVEGLLRQRHGR